MIKNLFLRAYYWWVSKKYIVNVDFQYADLPDSLGKESIGILILRNPYKQVKIAVYNISLSENSDGSGQLNYEVTILENPNKADLTVPKFDQMINDIMRVVISTAFEVDKNDEVRALDSAQSNEERNIREEVPAVPEARVSKRKSRKKTVSGDSELSSTVQQPTKRKRNTNKSKRKEKSNGE